jgi:hypothetical protein
MSEKACSRCKEVKPVSAFSNRKLYKDGLEIYCRACKAERYNEYAQRNASRAIVQSPPEKMCRYCKEIKPSHAFHKRKERVDGLREWCKPCVAAGCRDARQKLASRADIDSPKEKRCYRCHSIKPAELFGKSISRVHGLQEQCKPCRYKRDAEYRQKYRARVKLRGIRINAENKGHAPLYMSEEELTRLLNSHSEMCDMPGCEDRWSHLDHCHRTGAFRGSLCIRHNMGLGSFRDNIADLQRAIDYLTSAHKIG